MKLYFLILLISCLIFSCGRDKAPTIEYQHVNASDSLTFYAGLPVDLQPFKGYLFVNDFLGDEGLVHVVDIEQDSILFSFLQTGGGPNEVVSLANMEIFTVGELNVLGVFDGNMKRYRGYDIDSVLAIKTLHHPLLDKSVDIPYSINGLYKIDRGYVATGFFPDGKFALLNDSLELKSYTGQYRPKKNEGVAKILDAQANIGKSKLSPSKKQLASVVFHAGIVEFYEVTADSIVKKWEFVKDELDYTTKNGKQVVNKGVEGFISVDVTDEFVFALYSGDMFNMDEVATYGKFVYQFDLKGNLINTYELDRKVLDIHIDGNELRSIVHNPEPKVIVYNLAEIGG